MNQLLWRKTKVTHRLIVKWEWWWLVDRKVNIHLHSQSLRKILKMKMTKLVEIERMWETWRKNTLHFHEEAPGRNGLHPHAIFVIMRSGGSVVKIGMKIATHLSTNVSAYAPRVRFIFSTGKNMATSSELISQMVMYLHSGSHIKSRRVNEGRQKRT